MCRGVFRGYTVAADDRLCLLSVEDQWRLDGQVARLVEVDAGAVNTCGNDIVHNLHSVPGSQCSCRGNRVAGDRDAGTRSELLLDVVSVHGKRGTVGTVTGERVVMCDGHKSSTRIAPFRIAIIVNGEHLVSIGSSCLREQLVAARDNRLVADEGRQCSISLVPVRLDLHGLRRLIADVRVGTRVGLVPVRLYVLFGVIGDSVQLGLVACTHEAVGRIRGNGQIRAVDFGHSLCILLETVDDRIGSEGLQERTLQELVAVVGNGGNFIGTDRPDVVTGSFLFRVRGGGTLVNVVQNAIYRTFGHLWASLRSWRISSAESSLVETLASSVLSVAS